MSLPITFRSADLEKQWDANPPELSIRLVAIVTAAAVHAFMEFGWIFCITSLIRTADEDRELGGTGIHVAGRAADVRTVGVKQEYVDAMTQWINDKWVYDQDRPSLPVAYSKPHGSGPHLHIQAHQHTKARALPVAA